MSAVHAAGWAGASGLAVAGMLVVLFATAYGFEAGYRRQLEARRAVARSRASRAGVLDVPLWLAEPCSCGALAGQPCYWGCESHPVFKNPGVSGVSYATSTRKGQ